MSNFSLNVQLVRALWLVTAICIYLASFSGRFLQNTFPELIKLIPLFGLILFLAIAYYLWTKKLTKPALLMLFILGLGALISESFILFPIERVHYYKYSFLGVLSYFGISSTNASKHFFIAFFAAALIGITEETAQLGIPNRFFDWRDIGLNLFSAAFGVLAAILADRFSFK